MSKHEATEITNSTSLGDDSLHSFCSNCNKEITLFGVYDDDRGVVYAKDWAVETFEPSSVYPNVRVGRFDKECFPELAN
jgi:hypothetical protein